MKMRKPLKSVMDVGVAEVNQIIKPDMKTQEKLNFLSIVEFLFSQCASRADSESPNKKDILL
jgi:hypothetical protein